MPATAATRPVLRLLIVEDMLPDAELEAASLRQAGYALSFDVADSPELFQQRLEGNEYDLILCDHNLRSWLGTDALELLKLSGKEIPFVVVTATLGDEAAVEYVKQGAADYVLKGRLERLPVVVERALREKAQRDGARRLQEEVVRAKEEWELTFDTVPDPVFVLDEQGRVIHTNRAAADAFGAELSQFHGRHWCEVVNPAAHHHSDCPLARALETDDVGRFEVEVPLFARVYETSAASLRRSGGGISGHICVMHDITQRRRAEAALQASEERYRDLFENAKDLIFTLDLDGRTTSANKACREALGYSNEEILQVSYAQIVAPEHLESERVFLTQMRANKLTTATREVELVAKNGQRILVEAGLRWIHHAGAPIGVQGIVRDITERKNLEGQLRQAMKMEAVGRLAGGVAHDFNNLLMVISGYADLLMEQGEDMEKRSKAVREIQRAADRAAELTRQLLAFSRKQVLQPRVLDLNSVVTSTERMLQRLIGEDIDLVVRLAPGLGNVQADPGQIEQVILNLAVNSRDAMPDGGKLLIETANVELDDAYARRHAGMQAGSFAMLAVTDTGCGMDSETLTHIFEPFYTTKKKGKGTGLGLATAYGIVKQSGGYIWVYSEPGKGTTFKIYLSRVAERAEVRKGQAPSTGPTRGSETVLLVEDEEKVRELIHDALVNQGYRVLVARDGSEALQIAADHTGEIELLITDVVMPRMSGRQLALRIAELRPTTKVLYISGYTEDAIVHHGVLDSGVAFLQKPFAGRVLCRKVRQLLQTQQAGAKARPN